MNLFWKTIDITVNYITPTMILMRLYFITLLKNVHQIGELASVQNKLFITRSMGEDVALGTSLTGIFEWSSDIAIAESRRGNVLVGLQSNDDFLAWHTSMPHQAPSIYDVIQNTLYEFTESYVYSKCEYTFYLNGSVGLLYVAELDENYTRTGEEKYLLFKKA
jgi:hypothetical protein